MLRLRALCIRYTFCTLQCRDVYLCYNTAQIPTTRCILTTNLWSRDANLFAVHSEKLYGCVPVCAIHFSPQARKAQVSVIQHVPKSSTHMHWTAVAAATIMKSEITISRADTPL